MIFSLHLALLYFVFFLGEIPVSATDSDIFLDSLPADDSDSLSSSSLLPISFLSDNNNNDIINSNNLFGDGDGDGDAILDGGLTEDDPLLLSYCADSNSQPQEQQQQQPQSKRKTRRQDNNGSICHPPGASELSPPPPPSSPPLSPTITIPEIPDLFNSITNPAAGDSSSGDVYQNQGDVVGKISLEPPQFYCGIFTSQPQRFIVPVCGSGKFVDSVRMARGFYSWVGNSKLVTPSTFVSCEFTRFFCCTEWIPYKIPRDDNLYFRTGTFFDAKIGIGYSCENLFDKGWRGLFPDHDPEVDDWVFGDEDEEGGMK